MKDEQRNTVMSTSAWLSGRYRQRRWAVWLMICLFGVSGLAWTAPMLEQAPSHHHQRASAMSMMEDSCHGNTSQPSGDCCADSVACHCVAGICHPAGGVLHTPSSRLSLKSTIHLPLPLRVSLPGMPWQGVRLRPPIA